MGFLAQYNKNVIFDEIQRVPSLFSYLQTKVDKDKINGQFILTGSQHFLMLKDVSQSLAGRIAIFNLYPFSLEELKNEHLQEGDVFKQIWIGGYPRLFSSKIESSVWLGGYIQKYLERDIRTLSQISNLRVFENFLHLIAGRSGQLLDMLSLGNAIGVTHNTIRSWISLLETSGIVFLLSPYLTNLGKRVVKTPKLYFLDTGLMCKLLEISSHKQLPTHPLYGAIFETFVVSEYFKYISNHNTGSRLYFWRNRDGLEADLVVESGIKTDLYEIKSSQTVPVDPFDKTSKIRNLLKQDGKQYLIYSGKEKQNRSQGIIYPWLETPML